MAARKKGGKEGEKEEGKNTGRKKRKITRMK